ncbi:hypothetical protein [Neisseria meningitidis]|nr:hypothetical protein [Neisseria meningitidis]MCL5916278.1 hypothetical protein [Neisseria meningitidis]
MPAAHIKNGKIRWENTVQPSTSHNMSTYSGLTKIRTRRRSRRQYR